LPLPLATGEVMTRQQDAQELFSDLEGEQPFSSEDIVAREVISTPYDASVRTLIDDIRNKELIVNPDFQRGEVWPRRLKSRLIESLLLNIPIPVLYFAEDDDGTRVVIDGQQRLRAISEFFSGGFALGDLQVLAELNDKSWTDISAKIARTILNRTLRCVVISSKSSPTLRFEMFERLNTGSVQLNDQELRNCIFRGSFNVSLDAIVRHPIWLSAVDRNEPDARLRDHELALRFLALRDSIERYRPPLKRLLNDFMALHRRDTGSALEDQRRLVLDTVSKCSTIFRENAFRSVRRQDGRNDPVWDKSLNRAVFDVQMLGLEAVPYEVITEAAGAIREKFVGLCLENSLFVDAISRATADRARFYVRLRTWQDAMRQIGIPVAYSGRLPES
jgi:hypothetical protein